MDWGIRGRSGVNDFAVSVNFEGDEQGMTIHLTWRPGLPATQLAWMAANAVGDAVRLNYIQPALDEQALTDLRGWVRNAREAVERLGDSDTLRILRLLEQDVAAGGDAVRRLATSRFGENALDGALPDPAPAGDPRGVS